MTSLDDRQLLIRHLREKHPNLLSSTISPTEIRQSLLGGDLPWMSRGVLPQSGLSDLPYALLVLIHQTAHLGLWSQHSEDDWLCREK